MFTIEDSTTLPTFDPKPLTSVLQPLVVTQEMVAKKLKALRPDKSPGIDQLHPRVLKELAEELAAPLTIIYNTSLREGELPTQWREANICPIFKKGDKEDPANYRPVSLTSIVCKVLERIICEVIIKHIKDNDLTCQQQHGFSKGKSVVTNLLEALDVWTEALSHNIPVDVIFLDYAKAFDTVPHERLLRKMEALGITGNLLQWTRQFLTRRRQQVSVDGTSSGWKPVINGVPQGSVLGLSCSQFSSVTSLMSSTTSSYYLRMIQRSTLQYLTTVTTSTRHVSKLT